MKKKLLLKICIFLVITGVLAGINHHLGRAEEDGLMNVDAAVKDDRGIPYQYLVPRWFDRRVELADGETVEIGKPVSVVCSVTSLITDMSAITIAFSASGNVSLTDVPVFEGSIKKGETRDFTITTVVKEKGRLFAWLEMYVESDFPRNEILHYIDANKDTEYSSELLRKQLVDSVKNYPDKHGESCRLILE